MGQVEAFAAEWEALLVRTQSPEIFRSWPWIASWWQIFGGGAREPFVIVVREGDTVVGLAPFLLRSITALGPARLRRLEFMGTGEDQPDEVCSDFLDLFAAAGHEDAVARAIWQRLLAERGSWDEAVFRSILDGSLLTRLMQPMARQSGCGEISQHSGARFWVDLKDGSFGAYVERLSKKKRKRIFYYRRRLEKEGGIVERRLERKDEIPLFLSEIARLSRLRRGGKGMASAWQSEKFRRFHDVLAPRLWDLGWLDLRLWLKEGRCVAALYNFIYEGTIYYYQSGFDTEAFGNVSPGLVTISNVIEWGFQNQMKRYDFLVGAEGSYIEDYACVTEAASDLTLHSPTGRGQVLRWARELKGILSTARELVVPPRPREKAAPSSETVESSEAG